MKNISKGGELFIPLVLIISFLIFVPVFINIGVFLENKSDEITSEMDKVILIKDDILIRTSDGKEFISDLPKKFDSGVIYSYNFIPRKIDKDEKLYLYIKISYLNFKITYKDELVYETKNIDTSFIKSGGDYIRMIALDDKYIGKELTISFESIKDTDYGILIKYIALGSVLDIMTYLYFDDFDVVIISIILLVFSIESFFIQIILILFKKSPPSALLGSFYALVLALYIIIRKAIFYFFIPMGTFIYILDYILFLLLPLLVALFILSVARKKEGRKKVQGLIEFILSLFIIYIIVQIILTIFGYIEFMEIQKELQIVVVSTALISIMIPFTIDNFEFKRILSMSMAILMVLLVILLGVYLDKYQIRYMTILGVVGGVFIMFQLMVIMKMYSKKYTINYRAGLNKKLAFTDTLTRLLNRNAFENDIEEVEKHGKNMMLMILDINNLKDINDTFGHNAGDLIINSLADILHRAKRHFNKVKAYRIGGDEFVLTAFDIDENYAQNLAEYLNENASEFRKENNEIPLSFGMAYELSDIDERFNIHEFIQIVDEKMYEDKKIKKMDFVI